MHLSYARAADSNLTGATRPVLNSPPRRLAGFAVSFPLNREASGYVCIQRSCGFSFASSVRGGCSNGASLQPRSPTLTPTRPNARPASPALPARGKRARRLQFSGRPSRPYLTGGYPSLRAKGRSTPLLRRPNPSILRRPAGRHAVGRPVGEMRSYARGRISDASPAKSLQTRSQRRGNQTRPKRSSGGLLRS